MRAAVERLRAQSSEWGIELEPSQLDLLSAYADLLASYEHANVIGIRDPARIITEHLSDSLSCLLIKDLWSSRLAIDIGAGGGLPGLPLAISYPALRVTLLEATEKKVRFLNYVRENLGLQNLEIIQGRVEDKGKREACREAFDFAVARALAELPVVVEYCAPLVRVGGQILAMKGRLPEEELSRGLVAARELGVEVREVREVQYRAELPQKERRLVVFDKLYATPGKFPRRVGLAKKRPLGI
jgi:16S rRNA (guanine527-N7)-methyltransferase